LKNNPYFQQNPYSLGGPIREAKRSIDACVVIGGSLFEDPSAYKALLHGATRGVQVRLLLPDPNSKWLREFALNAKTVLSLYIDRIMHHAKAASMNVEGIQLRWYETPGPCWFVLIDGHRLYTKPITSSVLSFPVAETKSDVAVHFNYVFLQLWNLARTEVREKENLGISPVVTLVQAPQDVLKVLAADPEGLRSLTPEAFELFVADRLSAMHLAVKRVGYSNQKDGGIDLLAWPQDNAPFPFLMAVQIKHSRMGRRIGPAPVRDLRGVLSSQPLDAGIIVTNTTFTADARWAASESPRIIRLRDFDDLVRWIRSDFATEVHYKELPEELLLAPGVRIHIPH
jgi:hypothetical protein